MAQQNRATIKTYFETGDVPTQGQFANSFDSQVFWVDDVETDLTSNSDSKVPTVKAVVDAIAALPNPTLSDVLDEGNTSGPNDVVFDPSQGILFDNGSRLREGTIDAGLGGNKGVAQICGAGYELKWEAGRLYVMNGSGDGIRQSLYNFTTTPTATDDSSLGYAVGSLWTLDDGTTYECIDATATSADWIKTNQSKFIEVTKAQLLALEGAGTLSVNVWYKITDALGSTAKILVSATSVSIVSKSAINLTDGTFGQYTLNADTYVAINGTVTSVNSGTNISVDNTNPAAPIINSLADRYKTTSTTSILIGNGSKTFTVSDNLAYIPLQEVLIVYDAGNHMHGTVTSYSGTTLIVDVKNHTGSGTFASWVINLDGTPVDAITGVGTVNRLAYFTAAQVIDDAQAITGARALKSDANGIPTHFDIATEPSLTELARVKGVTSAIQTQLNARRKTLQSTGLGTAVTLTTANTYCKALLIPANTFIAGDIPMINARIIKTGTLGGFTPRFYLNTSNNISGSPVLVGTGYVGTNSNPAAGISRIISIEAATGANTYVHNTTTALGLEPINYTGAESTLTIDWTVDQYLIVTIQLVSGSDSANCRYIMIN